MRSPVLCSILITSIRIMVTRCLKRPLLLAAIFCLLERGDILLSAHVIAAPKEERILVAVDTVTLETVVQCFHVVGRLLSLQSGIVSAETSGAITQVAVEVGDRVVTGQLLARLDTNTLLWRRQSAAAAVAEKRARAAEAESIQRASEIELKRLEYLRRSTAFSLAKYEDKAGEVERLRAAAQAAVAAVDQALANMHLSGVELAKAEIKAPYPGAVRRRYVEIGSYVSLGAHIIDLVNDCNLEIEADIAAEHIADIKPGTKVMVQISANVVVPAIVRAIVPDEDPRTRTRLVRFTFDAPSGLALAANQSITIQLQVGGGGKVPTVSKDAIVHRERQTIAFVIEEGVAKPRLVRLGKSVGARFAVENGLWTGEQVVIRGNEYLQSGQSVRLIHETDMSNQSR